MKRAVKLSLKFITNKKKNKIKNLLFEYHRVVNCYIKAIWNNDNAKLDKQTKELVKNTRLSERYKSKALKQAIDIVITTKKSAKALKKHVQMSIFKGNAILDSMFVNIEESKNLKDFDLVLRLSTLNKGKRITLPLKKTKVFNKWKNKPLSKIIQGCALSESHVIVWIDLPDLENKKSGKTIGLDIGVNKLIVDSDGNEYGKEFIQIRKKIQRKKRNSKAYKRTLKERDNYINRIVNQLPYDNIKILGIEKLLNLKKGKSKKRSKNFRKAMIPWRYRQVISRIECKAQENRIRLVKVNPVNTSRTCPICSEVSKNNRKGEIFKCIRCNYTSDSDYVGAFNVLIKTLRLTGSLESPVLKKVI